MTNDQAPMSNDQRRLFVVFLVILACGCDQQPYKLAEVSGKVTLDGKALPKASVTFAPMATKGNEAPGPTAQAMTDAEGKYVLTLDKDTSGAVVGKCRIYITTILSDPATDDRDAGGPVKRVRDKVPANYNQRTELTFDVPAGGTNQANFDLKSQ
jgi:hypothetical protein